MLSHPGVRSRTAALFLSRTAALFLVAAGGATAAACSSDQATVPEERMAGSPMPVSLDLAAAPRPSRARAEMVAGGVEGTSAARLPLPGAQAARDSVAPSMVIRNGAVVVQVDSLEPAMASIRALATRLGGYIGNVNAMTGEFQVRSATMELKIPASRFDEAMAGMAPLGKVENSSASAEDVGEEFVDVSARVANARRLEDRLVNLLATRTGKLEDVLAVERELARVREEVERYEGRIRYLRSRVATSTITVTAHEKAPLVNPNPGTSVIGGAFANMWRNFVHFVAWLIESLGVVVPAGVLVALAVLGWRQWRRRPTPPAAG